MHLRLTLICNGGGTQVACNLCTVSYGISIDSSFRMHASLAQRLRRGKSYVNFFLKINRAFSIVS